MQIEITRHLVAVDDLIQNLARSTIATAEAQGDTKKARKVAQRMTTAKTLRDAADALYEIAERIAGGEPIKAGKRGDRMALALRTAEVKCQEALGQMGAR